MSRAGRDFGSRIGSGGVASSQHQALHRKEVMKKIAMESFSLDRDPYMFRNSVGIIECRLCSTHHKEESNYAMHTQGKRHQTNLAKRAAKDQKDAARQNPFSASAAATAQAVAAAATAGARAYAPPQRQRIGRPGYRITKQRDPETNAHSLLFQLEFPDIDENTQPLYRFMSSWEQRKEPPHPAWQLILFAAEPYETVAFKIPSQEIVRDVGTNKFFTDWDAEHKTFTLQLVYKKQEEKKEAADAAAAAEEEDAAMTTQ